MPRKQFKHKTADIRRLATGRGSCIASDSITVDGLARVIADSVTYR